MAGVLCPFGRKEPGVKKSRDRKIERFEFTPIDHIHRVDNILSIICSIVLHILLSNPSLQALGPVVQSVVSLTSLLRGQLVKCLTTL